MYVTAQSYIYRKHKRHKNCPYSDIVATESQCNVASDLLDLRYIGALTSTNKPAGCYWGADGNAGFNTIIDPSQAVPEEVTYGTYYGGICMVKGKCYNTGSFTHSVCIIYFYIYTVSIIDLSFKSR